MKTQLGVALILLMVAIVNAANRKPVGLPGDDCPDDYSPYCTCQPGVVRFLKCTISAKEEFDAIRTKLSQVSKTDFYRVLLVLTTELEIPENILGTVKTFWLDLSCSDRSKPLGPIHANAFISTKNENLSLKEKLTLTVHDCDLSKTSFAFLSQLSALSDLRIETSSIKEILEMPHLTNLTRILIKDSTSLETWYNPSQTPNLERIEFESIPDLDDAKMDSILSSMTKNFIYPKLSVLLIEHSKLTRIPPLISAFPALSSLVLEGNPITTLAAGSVKKGSTQLEVISLSGTGLTTIEPGTFVGDFSSTRFFLNDKTSMASFPSAVFKDLLKSMVNRGGSIEIENNPIAFDCNLNWLLVDNRDLLPHVNGAIANGTRFEDLNPQELNC